jgi:hypothetical protein
MRYSSYRHLTIAFAIFFLIVSTLALATVSITLALLWFFVVGFAALIAMYLNFSLTQELLDRYNGQIPMPGLALFDLVDDDPVHPASPSRADTGNDYDSNELNSR